MLIGIKGVRLISEGLSSTELATWYRGGMGFIFPSLHETFGIPILEAMACGCPVITSNDSACPDVAGDSVLFVNPHSIDDITNAMKRLIEDDSLRQKGLARSRQFTWRKSAEKNIWKYLKKYWQKRRESKNINSINYASHYLFPLLFEILYAN